VFIFALNLHSKYAHALSLRGLSDQIDLATTGTRYMMIIKSKWGRHGYLWYKDGFWWDHI